MIQCSEVRCLQNFASIDEYVAHLKSDNLKEPYVLKCTFENCPQFFSSFYKLRRHLKSHYFDEIEPQGPLPSTSKRLRLDDNERILEQHMVKF